VGVDGRNGRVSSAGSFEAAVVFGWPNPAGFLTISKDALMKGHFTLSHVQESQPVIVS
jgi:hypothetical protein